MIDIATLTGDELRAHYVDVLAEMRRRDTIASAPVQAAALADAYAAAIGRKDGDPWAQPVGAHDAYTKGITVTHGGKTWESLTPANVWTPGVSGWREKTTAPTVADFVQPTGAHDAYAKGARIRFDGKVYESKVDGNVYSPSAYPPNWLLIA